MLPPGVFLAFLGLPFVLSYHRSGYVSSNMGQGKMAEGLKDLLVAEKDSDSERNGGHGTQFLLQYLIQQTSVVSEGMLPELLAWAPRQTNIGY